MSYRGIRKQKLLVIGMAVLALTVSCSDSNSGQKELGAVSGLSPADGSSTTDTAPTFSWTEVTDAAGYEVRLAGSKEALDSDTPRPVTGTSYTPTAALTNNQDHYWQVRAKDAGGQYGPWSAVQSLKVEWGAVSGLSPADGSSTTDTAPTFSWTDVTDAAGYEVRLADSKEALDSGTPRPVTGTSYTPTAALTNNQDHYWQVRAKDAGGQYGPWSAVQSLKVEWGAVSGLSPADGSITWDTAPTFSWTDVTDAAGYEVRMAGSKEELDSDTPRPVTGLTYTPASALTIGQTHYWQVRAKDGAGQNGPWTNANSLQVESDAVSGLNPADGSSATDPTPTFSWTEVPGAAEYEVRIADSQDGLASALSARVTDSSHTPTSALTIGQTHYWQVRAKDGAGQNGPWSAVAAIQIDYSIGDTGPAGGIVFYDKGSYSDGWRYLEAAPSDQSSSKWGGDGTSVSGTSTGIGTGKANTEAIVTELGSSDNYAAKLCSDLELGSYDDWFLPSMDELDELYDQKSIVGGFASGYYWSSSQYDSYFAQGLDFGDGSKPAFRKKFDKYVRAVRAF